MRTLYNKISQAVKSCLTPSLTGRAGVGLLLLALTACSKDGDLVTVGRGDALTLDGSNNIVLDPSNATGLALTLHWNDNHQLSTNYVDVLVPDGTISNTLQISKTEDFASCYNLEMSNGVYQKQFTNAELNGELTKLGFEAYEEQPMYVRVASTTGANIEPQYSNTLEFSVITYKIDYTYAIALSKDKTTELGHLYSPTENGIYTGFLALGGWGNWWLMENDGTTWGNTPVDGSVFNITSSEPWNLWSSGFNGCRYVTVNTKQKFWNEISIPSVTVSGGITGDMTFNKEKKQWTLVYTAESTSPVTLQFSSPDSKLYNTTTGDSEDQGISTPLYFTSAGISTTAPEAITLSAPQTGDCTVTIDLSGKTPAYSIEAGAAEGPEVLSPILYVLGNDDKWDYDEWIRLSDEDSKTYTGAVYMKSSWGYYFSKEFKDWKNINQDPETSDKKLKVTGSNDCNILAPGEGLYVVSASLGWMSYWYEMEGAAITSVSCAGYNEAWTVTEMTATETPGVYVATIDFTGAPYGMQILINGSWEYWFGTRSDGNLTWKAKDNGNPVGIDGNGTYTFTVDICHGTYSLTK